MMERAVTTLSGKKIPIQTPVPAVVRVQPDRLDSEPISDTDAGLVETALAYIEGDNYEAALGYIQSMSPEGLRRTAQNFQMMSAMVDRLIESLRAIIKE